ncbi:H/ACA ribonucleoprotein complex subunit 4-like [Phragmites australis]|uniref:H/ACA ribonucleoprotein complex subunit 4-like n=1 Tax=Phragmites australis TaxID=29695 RepID=UPI002D77C1C9|nr:H/ACA ribonucleoprotein complex subunit 4-like [Phragmites australis]XP_062206488.1 H/ACA ribonucleoprotein complex subunit 4-like [Phragmites australis]XP_062206495.1 H/ACA ribonucleoprotein complex subunit 4-like [Phragmites australis]XP_062206505.1 H/ACA ribonucleoprotein complex subunit 4-like [Phragmites australis]XP_062206511.1 H/ACA ribonucleoprotein complex subunit 4-like [Phragmites australis]XP_062206518.1 H/ACA ribonucleoprotein complex subunit 4-like [Phragmites australis]
MRAITGAVVSSKPCSLAKAARILALFADSAASHLPSSDCATYLRTAADATTHHHLFRRDLRSSYQHGANNLDAHDYEVLESERKNQDGGRNRDTAVPAGGTHDSAAETELEIASGEKKIKKRKKRKKKEDPHEDIPVPGVASHSTASHWNKEIVSDVKQEAGLVAEEELGSEKKKGKKKKEKDHVKLEEDVVDVKEAKGQIVNNGAAEQGIAVGEKKRKKKRYAEEEGDTKDVKEKNEKMVTDGDLDNDKKRKKKRGRGDHDDNGQEQAEHTKKKQRKQS